MAASLVLELLLCFFFSPTRMVVFQNTTKNMMIWSIPCLFFPVWNVGQFIHGFIFIHMISPGFIDTQRVYESI